MTNELEKTERELSPKELAFCEFYTALGSDTCGNGTASAKQAGYSQPHNAAWKMLQRPVIRAEIKRIHGENMDRRIINPERILYELEHTKLLAQKKNDLSTVVRCIELMGKYLAMFSDRHTFVAELPQSNMSPEKQEDLRRIAELYYTEKYLAAPAGKPTEAERGREGSQGQRAEILKSGALPPKPPVANDATPPL